MARARDSRVQGMLCPGALGTVYQLYNNDPFAISTGRAPSTQKLLAAY